MSIQPTSGDQFRKVKGEPSPLELLGKNLRRLREDDAGVTMSRLLTSRHIADLQLLAFVVVFAFLGFSLVAMAMGYWQLRFLQYSDQWKPLYAHHDQWWFWPVVFGDVVARCIPFVGAALTVGAGILAWCYRTGSERLGIVDLFACEITTLCRVCTIVDLTRTSVDAFEGKSTLTNRFDSAESNTPVFDACAKDLRVLCFNVITNITEFYTYWNSMRSMLRVLAAAPTGVESETLNTPGKFSLGAVDGGRRPVVRDAVYMQFLAFESARNVVNDLIEFEPEQVANTITILLSELVAYEFLLEQFKAPDARQARLALRFEDYRKIVERLSQSTRVNVDKFTCPNPSDSEKRLAARWGKSFALLHALEERAKKLDALQGSLGARPDAPIAPAGYA